MTKITCSREVTNMQERSNKHAGITCNRAVTNLHCERRKTYCRSKKNYGYVQLLHGNLSRYEHAKMFGFLDEKYTPGNLKNMHATRANILVKHAS
jgi:hypothetical protein